MREDAGVYLCSASNTYGKQEKTIKLVVLGMDYKSSGIYLYLENIFEVKTFLVFF